MSKFIGTRLTLPNLATAPSSPAAGDAYYDTVANTAYVYNGTSWVALGASGHTHTSFANNLQINKADSKVQLLNTTSGSGTEDGMYLLMADSDVGYLWNAETNGALVFGTGGAERARITPAGKFGIGTNSPAHQLEVVGPASVTVGVSAGGAGFAELELVGQAGKNYITSDDTLSFDIGGTERATVATTGLNVTSGTLSQGGTAVSLSGHSHSTANVTSGNFAATVSGGTGVTVTGGTGNASTPSIAIDTATVPLKSDNLGAFATSTSAAIGVGTIELGHATDTTLARSAAGIVAVEGVTVVRLYSAALTGTGTSFTVTHGLGAVWVTAMVYDTTTGKYLIPDHTINLSSGTPTGTVTITFPASVTGSNYRVVITG